MLYFTSRPIRMQVAYLTLSIILFLQLHCLRRYWFKKCLGLYRLLKIEKTQHFYCNRSVRTAQKIAEVQRGVDEDADKPLGDTTIRSCRRNNWNVRKSSCNRIIKKECKMTCYVFNKCFQMELADPRRRLAFSNQFVALSHAVRLGVVCSDEAYFSLNGTFNKQNDRRYAKRKVAGQGGRPRDFR